jgi:hypothetical protein
LNLHGIVSASLIPGVNPLVPISIQRSTGYTTNADGTQVPTYASPVSVFAQIQALTYTDLTQIDGMNIQGERRSVYINGRTDAIIRGNREGGDLITWNGIVWLNVHVLEYWPDWCKFIITRQDGS